MATETFSKLAKLIVANGERTSIDSDSSVFDLSELALVVENRKGKAFPAAITFVAFGLSWTRTAAGELQMIDDSSGDIETLAVDEDSHVDQLEAYLEWRLGALEALGI